MRKLSFLDQEYEEGIINEDYYVIEHKKQIQHYNEVKKNIEKLQKKAIKSFNELPVM